MALISIYLGGALTLLMALFHTRFAELFKWRAEYDKLSPLNRRIFFTIHLALLLLFVMLGAVSMLYAPELARCQGACVGFESAVALFWLWRAAWQVIYFKGGAMHWAMVAWFALLFLSYAAPVAMRLR